MWIWVYIVKKFCRWWRVLLSSRPCSHSLFKCTISPLPHWLHNDHGELLICMLDPVVWRSYNLRTNTTFHTSPIKGMKITKFWHYFKYCDHTAIFSYFYKLDWWISVQNALNWYMILIIQENCSSSDWTEYLINKKPCPHVCTYSSVHEWNYMYSLQSVVNYSSWSQTADDCCYRVVNYSSWSLTLLTV